jgi:hypothetical protein
MNGCGLTLSAQPATAGSCCDLAIDLWGVLAIKQELILAQQLFSWVMIC